MTNEFQYLLRITSSVARGDQIAWPSGEIDWDKLVRLAKEQSVPFLLAYAIRRRRDLDCPQELRREWSSRMFAAVMEANGKRRNALSLLREMEDAGFAPVLLKGYVASDCYAVPDCRISSDVDILVPAKQEARVCAFLQRKGFSVAPRWTDGHHSVCTHPDYGTLEIHASLFDRLVADIWFRDLQEDVFDLNRCVQVETDGGSYRTLGFTDNLLFMTLHMVKHFINGGCSLRMLLDIGMFIRKYGEYIAFPIYWKVLKTLNYDRLTAAALWALVHFCGFSPADFPELLPEDPRQTELFLQDLERSGWMGVNTPDEAQESRTVYNAYVQRRGVKDYRLSLLNQKISNAFRRVFPARVVLLRYCPQVAESDWLLPLAWCQHLRHGLCVLLGLEKSGRQTGKTEEKKTNVPLERAKVLKQLGMM